MFGDYYNCLVVESWCAAGDPALGTLPAGDASLPHRRTTPGYHRATRQTTKNRAVLLAPQLELYRSIHPSVPAQKISCVMKLLIFKEAR